MALPMPSAIAYQREFAALVNAENAGGVIRVHDYAAESAPFYREFEESYGRHYRELATATTAADDSFGSLPTSVRSNVNTRRLELTFEQMKNLFGPRQVKFAPLRAELDQQARFAVVDHLAIIMACRDIDLPERLWPGRQVRATCHRGTKNGRAVLGLRCYPESYGASRLLLYHGMPLMEPDKRGVPRLIIVPEISLRGNAGLVRVVNDAGEPVIYQRG
jgi:hypothetical protein